jgi:hypothetical protein
LSNRLVEFFHVSGQNKERREPRFAQVHIRQHDSHGQIAIIEGPDIHKSGEHECCPFDRMNFGNALGRKPVEKIVEGSPDELWVRTIVTAISRLDRSLPQLARAVLSAE